MPRNKHHYIPKCYMKAWTGADGELCEYQFLGGRVVTRRRHPSATGWSDKLYSTEALPPQYVDIIETELFGRVDQDASDALDALIGNRDLRQGGNVNGWSRFLMSLMNRHPGRVAELKQMVSDTFRKNILENEEAERDPEGWFDWVQERERAILDQLFVTTIQNACNLVRLGQILNDMHKGIIDLRGHERLMTSDNPLYMSNGLGHADTFILLPLTPQKLYVAANTEAIANRIGRGAQSGRLVKFVNNHVVTAAHQFAYGVCENHAAFVAERWPRPVT